jgi:murein peptide amidase A
MVVMVPEDLHDASWAGEACIRADVDELHPRGHEAVDEILGEPPVDLRDQRRRPLLSVAPGVVHVDVAPVLMRHVHRPKWAASLEADVADADTRSRRVRLRVVTDDAQDDSQKPVCTPAPSPAVGHAVENGIPREEMLALGGEPDASHQAAVGGRSNGNRLPPNDFGLGRRRLPGDRLAATGIREGGRTRGSGEGEHQRGKGDSHEQNELRRQIVAGSRTPARARTVSIAVSAAWLTAAFLAAISPAHVPQEWHGVFGYSERGRAIRAHRYGDFSSPWTILVVGCIHGDECEGIDITKRLARGPLLSGVDLWVVHNLNPDGRRLGTRLNGRGVDLNRNFGSEWTPNGERWDPQYSGPRPWSERETRLARRLVRHVRPDITIWYHQPQAIVRAWGGSAGKARRYARLAGTPYHSIRWLHGTAPNWQNHRFPGAASFVVELPPGRLGATAAARHARAVRLLLP